MEIQCYFYGNIRGTSLNLFGRDGHFTVTIPTVSNCQKIKCHYSNHICKTLDSPGNEKKILRPNFLFSLLFWISMKIPKVQFLRYNFLTFFLSFALVLLILPHHEPC